jgi:hypothetical protein
MVSKKHLGYIVLGTAMVLMIPLIAMRFSDDVDWKLPDFIIIGTLLFSIGLAYELIYPKLKNKKQKILVGVALGLLLVYLWAELAVGIFTNLGS